MPITLVVKAEPVTDPILQAAERMEPTIAHAFLDAVAAVKAKIDLKKLAEAITNHEPDMALAILAVDENFPAALKGVGLEAGIKSMTQAIQQTFAGGAEAAATMLPSKVAVNLAFDLLNPESVAHLNDYSFNLIRQVTQDQVESVRQVITRAFQEGGHPFQQAREIREVIGLTARQEAAVANYRTALEGGNYQQALDRALRDGRYDRSLISAINQDKLVPQERIDQMVDRYRSRYVDYRARNIARTESIRASAKGQRELWSQARKQGLLPATALRVWQAADSERTCEVCQDLDGQTAGLDEEFEPGIMEPPDPHPSCRCAVSIDPDSLKGGGADEDDEETEKRDVIVVVKYSEDEPRIPAGESGGGEWTSGGGIGETASHPSAPHVEDSPTAFLARMEIKDLPTAHLDGLERVRFEEGHWIPGHLNGKAIDAAGTYDPAIRTITLSSNRDNVWVYGHNTLAHEAGHHVHLSKLTDEAAKEWSAYSRRGEAAMISAYARSNQGEHFAEAYRSYYSGGRTRAALKNLEPQAYRFMASLNKANSARLVPPGSLAKLDWGRYS